MDVLHDQVLGWWFVDLRGHSLFFYTDKYTATYATRCTYLNPFCFCLHVAAKPNLSDFGVYSHFCQQLQELFCKKDKL